MVWCPSLMEEESVAWVSGQVYACLRIKGIYRVVWVPHSKAHSDGPCPTMSDMPTNRQADARTNLFSIRPMRSKLIVPHFWYVVVIPQVSPSLPLSLKRDPHRAKKNIHPLCIDFPFVSRSFVSLSWLSVRRALNTRASIMVKKNAK